MRNKRFFVLFLILLLLFTGCGKNNSDPTWSTRPSNDKTTKSDTDAGTTEPESEAGSLVLEVESFYFVESAFECGKEPEKSQVLAVIRTDVDSADIRLSAVCQETGDTIELTDDGRGTDTVAGDHIFYGEGSFSSEEEKKLAYSLHSESDQISVSAPDAFVKFYTVESCDAELDQIDTIQTELDDIAAEFSFDDTQEVETAAESYLKTAEKMENYLKGLVKEGIVESYEWTFPEYTIYLPIGAFVYTFGDFGNGFLDGGSETAYALNTISNDFSEDGDILLARPFGVELDVDFQSAPSMLTTTAELVSDYGFNVTVRDGEEVNKELLCSFDRYRIIVLHTHGGCNKKDGPFFTSGIPNEDIPSADYANRYLLKGSKGTAMVTSDFFDHYYQDKSLNGCLVYLGCCHCADSNRLATALINHGANAVLAFTNTTWNLYNQQMFRSVMMTLVEEDEDQPGITRTIGDAVTAAKQENGEKYPRTFEEMSDGNDELKPNFWTRLYDLYVTLSNLNTEPTELVLFEQQDKAFMSEFRIVKEPQQEDNEPVKTAYSDSGSVTIDFGDERNSFDYSYILPRIKVSSPDKTAMNDEIMDGFKNVVKDHGGSGEYIGLYDTISYEGALPFESLQGEYYGTLKQSIRYDSAIYEDVLSVRVTDTFCVLTKNTTWDECKVYSVDLQSGKRLTGYDLLERVGMTKDQLIRRLRNEIAQEARNQILGIEGYDPDAYDISYDIWQEILNEKQESISQNDFEEILNSGIYLNEYGNLEVALLMVLGAASEYTITAEIDPNLYSNKDDDEDEILYVINSWDEAERFAKAHDFELELGEGFYYNLYRFNGSERIGFFQIGTFSADGRSFGNCNEPCEITLCGIHVGDYVPDIEATVSRFGECLSTDYYTTGNGTEYVTIYLAVDDGTMYCLDYTWSEFTITSWYVYEVEDVPY